MKLLFFLALFIGSNAASTVFKKVNALSDDLNKEPPENKVNKKPTPTPTPTIQIYLEEMDPLVDERREVAKDYQREFLSAQININKMKQLDPAVYDPKRPILQIPTQNKKLDIMVQDSNDQKLNVMYPRFCCKCVFRKYLDVSNKQEKKIKKLNKKIQKYKNILKSQKRAKKIRNRHKRRESEGRQKTHRTITTQDRYRR